VLRNREGPFCSQFFIKHLFTNSLKKLVEKTINAPIQNLVVTLCHNYTNNVKPFADYQNPALATDLVVFGYTAGELSLLLLHRTEAPYKGSWCLPGAFVQLEETLEETGQRVLETKLGMSTIFLEQLYTFDKPRRDPRGRVVSVAYYALVNGEAFSQSAGTLSADARWTPVSKLPKLGFDHNVIFQTALARLRSKILYLPVGFELLDQRFTMSELHALYECILDSPIDRRNFNRKMLQTGFVALAGEKRTGGKNRPADLYQFNKDAQNISFNLTTP
jgi:8-oxo-dGTP diphosphatase